MPIKYPTVMAGEWVQPKAVYRMKCCDCGLVHRMEFRLYRNRLQFRAFRDERETNRLRTVKRT